MTALKVYCDHEHRVTGAETYIAELQSALTAANERIEALERERKELQSERNLARGYIHNREHPTNCNCAYAGPSTADLLTNGKDGSPA
jgi:exonuclease VII large subunit